jgi:hypothetical protein
MTSPGLCAGHLARSIHHKRGRLRENDGPVKGTNSNSCDR